MTGGFMPDITAEHIALLRQWGRLQTQIEALQRTHAHEKAQTSQELVRLRAQLIIRDTLAYWGMNPLLQRRRVAPARQPDRAISAQEVICQTGCIAHAHAGMDKEDTCRLLGGTCETLSVKMAASKVNFDTAQK
jgi:hypothetical protein